MRTVEELLTIAPDKFDITVFGAEPHGNYNRILLSPVLAGEKTIDQIMINDLDWYAERGITLHIGQDIVETVSYTHLDVYKRQVVDLSTRALKVVTMPRAGSSSCAPCPHSQRLRALSTRSAECRTCLLYTSRCV